MGSTAACTVCGKLGSRNGQARLGKYCDTHIPEGIVAGSVKSQSKRLRATSPAPSSSTQVSSGLPESWKLLEIKKVFGSRCVPIPAACSAPATRPTSMLT